MGTPQGTTIASGGTFNNTTLANLGVTLGTYTYNWVRVRTRIRW